MNAENAAPAPHMNRNTSYPCTVFVFSITALAYALMAGSADATTRTKANNTTNLNLTGSWSAGVVPGSTDIALWDSTVTAANTVSLGADLNFGEIQITNPGGAVTIDAGNTLTLNGVSGVGIDMSSATVDLTLNCAITLAAAQTWNVASGRNLIFNPSAAVNNGGNLLTIASPGFTWIQSVISGAGGLSITSGTALIAANNTYSGGTTISGTGMLEISTDGSLGSVPGSPSNNIQFTGSGTLLSVSNVSLAATRNITIANGATATFHDNSQSLTINGIISGGGAVRKLGGGTVTLTGANTYTGGTDVAVGTLTVSGSGTLGANTGSLEVDSISSSVPTVLNLNVNQTVGSLQGNVISGGSATINIASGKTLTSNQPVVGSTYAGVITGAGSLTKSGDGILTLSGLNTYIGVTRIDGINDRLDATTLANVNSASSIGKGSVAGSAADLVFGSGTLEYVGTTAASTDRLFTIGDASGLTAQINSNSTNAANTVSFTNTGAIAFGGSGARQFTLAGINTGNNTFAPILGDGPGGATSLAKFGPGSIWIITGANTYTGGTTVQVGTLTVNSGGTLGASTGGLTVNSLFNLPSVLNLNVDQTVGFLSGSVGTATATINIASTKTLTVNQSSTTSYPGVLAGAGSFTKSGSGTLTLSGTNTYSGITKIDGGILSVGSLANINTASGIGTGSVAGSAADLVFGGGTLQYSGTTGATSTNRLLTIGDTAGLTAALDSSSATAANTMSFTSTGAIAFGGTGARTLTLTGSNTGNNTFAAIIGDGTGGATSLNKSGSGTWILTGANTYSGGTNISGGTLLVTNTTGSGTGTGAVNVTANSSGTLAGGTTNGAGGISGAVTVNSTGNLSPGTSGNGSGTTAILHTGALTLNSGSNYLIDLNGTTAGTLYDQTIASNTVTINNANLMATFANNLTVGLKFFVIENSSSNANAVGNMFANAPGGFYQDGADLFLVNYADNGDGGLLANDISLMLVAVPEPSTWVAAGLSLLVIAYSQRRRLARALKRVG